MIKAIQNLQNGALSGHNHDSLAAGRSPNEKPAARCPVCGILLRLALPGGKPTQFFRSKAYDETAELSPGLPLPAPLRFPSLTPLASINIRQRNAMIELTLRIIRNLQFEEQTFHSAVAYLDGVLGRFKVGPEQMNLVTAACVFLSAKLNETLDRLPALGCYLEAVGLADFPEQFLQGEALVGRAMDFRLGVPTAHRYMVRYFESGFLCAEDLSLLGIRQELGQKAAVRAEQLARLHLNCSLRWPCLARSSPPLLATASLMFTRESLGLSRWLPELEAVVGVSAAEAEECLRLMRETLGGRQPALRKRETTLKRKIEMLKSWQRWVGGISWISTRSGEKRGRRTDYLTKKRKIRKTSLRHRGGLATQSLLEADDYVSPSRAGRLWTSELMDTDEGDSLVYFETKAS